MQVLCKLAEQPGDVFTRAELLDSVWHGVNVGEEALTRSVSELRKAFGDDPKEPAFIETIYKTGYRLLAPVETEAPIAKKPVSEQDSLSFQIAGNRPVAAFLAATLLIVVISATMLTNTRSYEESDAYTDFRISPLTSLPGEELSPALSPDGRTVIFSWREPGARNPALVSQAIETGEKSILFSDQGTWYGNPSWSPSGEVIAFVRKTDSICEILQYDLHSRRYDSLVQCNLNSWPTIAWRPDGNAITISDRKRDKAPYSLYELSLVDASVRQITAPKDHIVGDRHAAYSFDGQSIAFRRVTATGIADIYLQTLLSDDAIRITFDDTKIGSLSWLNNEGEIIFTSNRRGEWDLWTINTDTRETSMFSVGAETFDFSYSPQAQRIAFEKKSVDTNLWRVDLRDPETPASVFASSTRWDDDPAFSNSGDFLAFVSDRSGTPEVWIAQVETGNVRRLTFFNGGLVIRPRWSPDDKELVFNARVNGNADIYSVNLETSVVSQITQHTAIDAMPEWSRDGGHILYTSNRSGDWQIWRRSSSGDEELQLTIEGGTSPVESVVLNGVLHERPGFPGLWLLDNTASDSVEAVVASRRNDAGYWLTQNDKVLFLEEEDGDVVLWRLDPLTHEQKRVSVLHNIGGDEIHSVSITMTHDGKYLVYSKVDARFSDIQLLELYPSPSNNTIAAKSQSDPYLQ